MHAVNDTEEPNGHLTSLTTPHARVDAEASTVEIPQLTRRAIFAIWAVAALPMAALSWLVAPVLADQFAGDIVPMAKALIVCLTVGLVWQFLRRPRPPRAADAPLVDGARGALASLPASPRSGRVGGRIWLILIPLIVAVGAVQALIPTFGVPVNRDLATLVESDAGKAFLDGAWAGTACSS